MTNNLTSKIKIIFIGTPNFAIPSLESLTNDSDFNIIAVVTQSDKKVGRKQIITPPSVKAFAQEHGIVVWQPTKIKEFINTIAAAQPDLIVVAAYAQIIPQAILDIPKYGCINVHGSLLPRYRGASCVQAAIINGDNETGVTIMKMEAGLDTGPIIVQEKIHIEVTENYESLYAKLAQSGGKILPAILKKYIAGELKPQQQDDNSSSYVKMLAKEDGLIDYSKTAIELERQVRAFNPWPGVYGKVNNLTLKILTVDPGVIDINDHPIKTFFLHQNELALQCSGGALIIKKLQLEGKKEMTSEVFLTGHAWIIGSKFE